MVAKAGFYSTNQFRAYPFRQPPDGPLVLPDPTIVDFGCLVGPDVGYDPTQHVVYLQEIERSGSILTFRFRSTCPGLAGRSLSFCREVGDSEYATQFTDSNPDASSSSSSGSGHCSNPIWSGHLVTGLLENVLSLLTGDGLLSALGTEWSVEPAVVLVIDSVVTSINLANRESTAFLDPCGGSGSSSSSGAPGGRRTIPYATCLVGDVKVVDGYNLSIRISSVDNSLTFSAAKGGGAGVACGRVSIVPGEPDPTGWPCGEVVRSINGLAGANIQVVGGVGVGVMPGPGDNELTVNIDLRGMAACPPA